jgi:hypothetical protein
MRPLVFIVNDPGVPDGALDDPYAGLDAETAAELREMVEDGIPTEVWWEWLTTCDDTLETFGAWLAAHHPGLVEGKAIGTGKLGGGVAARDAALRSVPTTQVRTNVRLGGINVARDLAPVVEEARASIGLLLRMWLRGRLPEAEAQRQMAKRWREAYERVREIGRRASGIDRLSTAPAILREEEEWFRSAVREELRLWAVFLEEIREDRVGGVAEFLARQAEGRLHQRFEAYLSALRFMYEASRVYALPRDVLVYWMGPKKDDPEICEGCVYMMERSPFPKDRLPAVPRDGSTECLTNCRHRIVLRVAKTLTEVNKRRAALPLREAMVKDLERIRVEHHGHARQRRAKEIAREVPDQRAVNPFAGQKLPPKRHEARDPSIAFDLENARDGDVVSYDGLLAVFCAGCDRFAGPHLHAPDDGEDEAAARAKDGTEKGRPAVINRPHDFRHEPHAPNARSIAKVDPTGYHGQHLPPGSRLIQASEAAFDTSMANTDLVRTAAALASAAKQRPLNTTTIRRLIERLGLALEFSILATLGRPDAMRFSALLRSALASLEDGVDVRAESIDPLRLPVARLRSFVIECSTELVRDGLEPRGRDGGLRSSRGPAGIRPPLGPRFRFGGPGLPGG